MTGRHPDDEPPEAGRPPRSSGAWDQGSGEGQDPSAPPAPPRDAPAPGLRSASSIFGEARLPENWPTRRSIRAAERAARETGEPPPVVPASPLPREPAPSVSAPALDGPADDALADDVLADDVLADDAPVDDAPAGGELTDEPPLDDVLADDALADDAPRASTAPHPRAIELPFVAASRADRAAEALAIDQERRRIDPVGQGRDDVDWLGRALGSDSAAGPATTAGPADAAGLAHTADTPGVHDVLSSSSEPPSFTDLLRVNAPDARPTDQPATPFSWTADEDGVTEAPAETVSETPPETVSETAAPSFDTTSLAVGSWSLADETEAEDEVVAGEQDPADTAADVYDAGHEHDELDQSEWDGRETSDTRAIDALFGTGALQRMSAHDEPAPAPQGDRHRDREEVDEDAFEDDPPADGAVRAPGSRQPQDVRRPDGFPFTRPPVSSGPPPADRRPVIEPRGARPARAVRSDNFINEGFGRLASEGRRGKQILLFGAVGVMIVMLVAVFLIARWIIAGDVEHVPSTPSSSPAAAPAAGPSHRTPSAAGEAPPVSAEPAASAGSVVVAQPAQPVA